MTNNYKFRSLPTVTFFTLFAKNSRNLLIVEVCGDVQIGLTSGKVRQVSFLKSPMEMFNVASCKKISTIVRLSSFFRHTMHWTLVLTQKVAAIAVEMP